MKRYTKLNRAIVILAVVLVALGTLLAIVGPRLMGEELGPWAHRWESQRPEQADGAWRGPAGYHPGWRRGPGMLGGLLFLGLILLLARRAGRWQAVHTPYGSVRDREPGPRETLRNRFADGAIDESEYRARKAVLDRDTVEEE